MKHLLAMTSRQEAVACNDANQRVTSPSIQDKCQLAWVGLNLQQRAKTLRAEARHAASCPLSVASELEL